MYPLPIKLMKNDKDPIPLVFINGHTIRKIIWPFINTYDLTMLPMGLDY